jgi:hypothetical protein
MSIRGLRWGAFSTDFQLGVDWFRQMDLLHQAELSTTV